LLNNVATFKWRGVGGNNIAKTLRKSTTLRKARQKSGIFWSGPSSMKLRDALTGNIKQYAIRAKIMAWAWGRIICCGIMIMTFGFLGNFCFSNGKSTIEVVICDVPY